MENLVKDVGDCGRYQFLLVPLSMASVPMSVWSMMHMVFGAYEPDWWCVSRDLLRNASRDHFLNGSSRVHRVADEFVDGNISNAVWDGSELDDSDVLSLLANASFKMCGADDNGGCERIVFAPGMNTVVSQFQLVCSLAWVPSMTISAQMIGVLLGSSVVGQLADSKGRKKSLVGVLTLHAIFNLISAFCVNWQMFAVMRVFIGFTTGGILAGTFAYPMEFIGVKWRAVVGSIPWWGVGAFAFSLLVWAVPDWSHVQTVTAVCTAACLLPWIFLPESVRWLWVKGHATDTHRVLHQMARWNRRKSPSVHAVQSLYSDSDEAPRKYNYFHIFSSWGIAKTSIMHGFMWFSCSLAYYGISFGIKNLSGDFFVNFVLMSLVEVPPTIAVYYLAGRLGRRWTCFAGCFPASLACLVVVPITLLMSDEEGGQYVNGLCLLAKACINLGWSAMTLYISELYPTVVRNIGIGYCNTVARFAGIIAPYILSTGEPYVFYVTIGVLMGLAAILPLLQLETRGQPLQDDLPVSSKSAKRAEDANQLQRLAVDA